MKILIERVYFRDHCTVGFLKLSFSGAYESKYIAPPSRVGGGETGNRAPFYFCDTLEPHAIPWHDDPFIGQRAERKLPGLTAIPEGTYPLHLAFSKTHRRTMPYLEQVPEFSRICLRTGESADRSRGEILVGKLVQPSARSHPAHAHAATDDESGLSESRKTFNLLFQLIEEAIAHDEPVTLELTSYRHWTYPP